MSGRHIKVLSLDPGFANIGWALIEVHESPSEDQVFDMGLITTKKQTKKRNLYEADDNRRRLDAILDQISMIGTAMGPDGSMKVGIHAIFMESLTRLPGKKASMSYGMAIGAITGLAYMWRVPVLSMMPDAVKKAVTYSSGSSKKEAWEVATEKIPLTERAEESLDDITKSKRHHSRDAVVIYAAFQDCDFIRTARRFLSKT